jgi:anaerobic selenocysteine-containing dehydrogenase
MFNFVRLSDGGPKRIADAKSEVEIITTLGDRLLRGKTPVQWDEMAHLCHVREMIAQIVPGWEKLASIDRTREEFTINGRTLHTPRFPTATGKARFAALDLPAPPEEHELRLMTVRSEGQFNTVVYEDEDIYRGQDRRDVILLNRTDIDRLGLTIDQRVTVRSQVGAMSDILVRAHDVRAGNAIMYFPEANVLVPTTVDPQSKTPAFKSVLITLEPAEKETGARRTLPMVQG